MRTYWIIWECEDSPNGYNQVIFGTIDEMVDHLLDMQIRSDGTPGKLGTDFIIKTIDEFENDEMIQWFLDNDKVEYNRVSIYKP